MPEHDVTYPPAVQVPPAHDAHAVPFQYWPAAQLIAVHVDVPLPL